MTDQIREILVPMDGSENALRAARFAVDMAKALDAEVRLFYVFPASSVEIIGMAGMSRDDIDQAAQAAAQRVFDKAHAELGDAGVKITDETSVGDPAEEVIRYTEDDKNLMVVIGRRGLSRMQSLLMGSVSERVLRYAKSPITVVT